VWAPCSRSSRRGLLHHAIDLLEGQSLRLGNEEIRIDECTSAETAPQEEDVGSQISFVGLDHVRGDGGNDGIPQPVGSGGERDTTGSNGERIDFSNKHPRAWSPSGSKEEDVDCNECDLSVDGRNVIGTSATVGQRVRVVETDGVTDDANEELADQHAESAPQEKGSSSDPLHSIERNWGGAHVYEGEDERDEERVADGAGGLQERGGIVKDEVDAGPLLHHLKRRAENHAADVALLVPERTGETGQPGAEISGLGDEFAFVFGVGDNL